MKFSLNWLKTYLKTTVTVSDIYNALNKCGLEVEAIDNLSSKYNDFKIAEIIATSPHPQADKLKICTVHDGQQNLQIVCGASNARAGIKVVLAPVGTTMPGNGMVIKLSKIRGVESQGMLCSADELALTEQEQDGILELPADAPTGEGFAKFWGLDDVIFEVAITPNRGDCASVLGIARELAAFGCGEFIDNKYQLSGQKPSPIRLDIQDADCWHFNACYIENLDNLINPPAEIISYLNKIGFNSKGTLVDISNFCMLSNGRPNHIYDADKVKGKISVRKAKDGESFLALGGNEYKLDPSITVVADEEKVLAIAGVIGGELSKVDNNTRNAIVEMAIFSPIAVMQAGRKLNINSDARFRFERRVDHGLTTNALAYLINLIKQYCGGVAHEVVSSGAYKSPYLQEVAFDCKAIKKTSGKDIEHAEVTKMLNRLGFIYQDDKVIIPSWRQGDVMHSADIVEEVIRLYGLENIEPIPFVAAEIPVLEYNHADALRQILVCRGLSELITWSFFAPEDAVNLNSEGKSLELKNPISNELSVMRSSVIPNLLKIAARNLARGQVDLGFFEIGSSYQEHLPAMQTELITGIRTGIFNNGSMHKDNRAYDFFDAKADILSLLNKSNLQEAQLTWQPNAPSYYHPGRSAEIKLGKKIIGYCGELHPDFLSKYDIDQSVVAFELFSEALPPQKRKFAKNKLILNNLQPVVRDFAFLLDEDINATMLQKVISQAVPSFINKVTIFDVYQGEKIPAGKKSIAVSVQFQPINNTFTESEIANMCDRINEAAQLRLNASLRA
jgi:phenylalanyl-tRNA synthetase beta chain